MTLKTPCLCRVQFTPTVQHCSMATLIGLCLRVKLMQTLPARFKVRPSWLIPGGRPESLLPCQVGNFLPCLFPVMLLPFP